MGDLKIKYMEEKMSIDESALFEEDVKIPVEKNTDYVKTEKKRSSNKKVTTPINCLRNERVVVKFVPKADCNVKDKRHLAYGGMMENAIRVFTVPMLSTGSLKNVLTDNEKAYLEEVMGLEDNALSIYARENNYWKNFVVRLTKQDTVLDLSDPNDYIKYKVLLANKNFIAPSMRALKNAPKSTYQFVIIESGDEYSDVKEQVNTTMKCYEEFGKVKDNFDILRCIIETLDGREVAANTKIEFLQGKAYENINANAKLFLETITDPYLKTKVLIKKAVDAGIISVKGGYYYLRSDGSPLCGHNEDPTFSVAAAFLSLPKNQELKFSIEAKTNN